MNSTLGQVHVFLQCFGVYFTKQRCVPYLITYSVKFEQLLVNIQYLHSRGTLAWEDTTRLRPCRERTQPDRTCRSPHELAELFDNKCGKWVNGLIKLTIYSWPWMHKPWNFGSNRTTLNSLSMATCDLSEELCYQADFRVIKQRLS